MSEIYIKDALCAAERMAIEAKRLRILDKPLPSGLEICDGLEKKMEKANGYFSRTEMLDSLKEMKVDCSPFISDSNNFYYKIIAPSNKIDSIIEITKRSGYIPVPFYENQNSDN